MGYDPIVVSKIKKRGVFGGLSDFEPSDRALTIETSIQGIEAYARQQGWDPRVTYYRGTTVKCLTYAADIEVVATLQDPTKPPENPSKSKVSGGGKEGVESKVTSVTAIQGRITHNPMDYERKKPATITSNISVHDWLPETHYRDLVRIVQQALK